MKKFRFTQALIFACLLSILMVDVVLSGSLRDIVSGYVTSSVGQPMNTAATPEVCGIVLAETQECNVSSTASYSRHFMSKDFDGTARTTTFLPGDPQAVLVMTVTVSSHVRSKWLYRKDDTYGWEYYAEVTSNITGTYDVFHYLPIAGNPSLPSNPRGWAIEVNLDDDYAFDEYFEITNNGKQVVTCKDIVSGVPVGMTDTFRIGVDKKACFYLSLDWVAYFNEHTGHCHDYLIKRYKPDGTLDLTREGGWSDYKDKNPTYDYWTRLSYESHYYLYYWTQTGQWKIEVYIDQCYDSEWEWYHVATLLFTINPPGDSPVAILSASPTDVKVHETVTFDGSASSDPDGGSIVSYWYDFGDGFDSGWTPQPTYNWEYTDPGDYYARLKVKDDEGEISSWSSTVHIHVRSSEPQISIYTDRYSYSVGETMYLGLDVINSDGEINVCFAVWVVRPGGSIYLHIHTHDKVLPANFTYSNPAFRTITLPDLPHGIYTWHAALLDPSTHAIIVEDIAEWEFS